MGGAQPQAEQKAWLHNFCVSTVHSVWLKEHLSQATVALYWGLDAVIPISLYFLPDWH